MTTRTARGWKRAARNRSAGGAGMYVPQRRKLLADLTGTVLEIGPGAGANTAHFGRDVRWLGLEPNPYLHERLREKARGQVIGGAAESIPLADHSVDAVVGTIVLCSVYDQSRVLAEIVRVLRPGGRYVFLEHVAAPDGTWSRWAQKTVAPVSRWLDGGCDPARETGRAIDAAGFDRVETEEFLLHGPFGVKIPHLTGWASTAG
ncbi:class I SAM-dependent methyltransferase [Amycolatopsis sp. YIM 10]|uniref:class I SAM-dependent methyltransferase n=1 Tax=Amycolatopsis sp. YIM 10 TaxID=2653857 RepID=UPI0012902D33|nr:class I SAM-dependent methyltransferase [Amycolatopsis sp. YIM 10]QFU93017.1 Ubiquinone/menaquinone biosynthesis C-methyltransferase UbiE [Amycolatopsis sp. YIM 10]